MIYKHYINESEFNIDIDDYEDIDEYKNIENIKDVLAVEHDLLHSNSVVLNGITVFEVDFSLLHNFSKHELCSLIIDLCEYISTDLKKFKIDNIGILRDSDKLCCLTFRSNNYYVGDVFITDHLNVDFFRCGGRGPSFILNITKFIRKYVEEKYI